MNNQIIPIWQPQGFSTHKITKRVSELYEQRATHTGTLDPMAEGVIVALLGEARFKKQELSAWKKTYEFEIVFGLRTDSFDAMGLLKEEKNVTTSLAQLKSKLEETLPTFIGEYEQEVPIYSAIRYKGKHLFEHARLENFTGILPRKKGHIYDLALIGVSETLKRDVVSNIIKRLENIVGDFRQGPIISQWKEYLKKLSGESEKVIVAKIKVETTRGIYVRSLSQDITDKIGEVGFVYFLVRTKNGDYEKSDCRTLEDIFGVGFCDTLFRSGVINLLE